MVRGARWSVKGAYLDVGFGTNSYDLPDRFDCMPG
jgi:hypothetical protein